MPPNYKDDSDRLVVVEMLTEANAKAIHELTTSISNLSKLMAKEDESLKASVKQLQENSIKCEARHSAFLTTLQDKKDVLAKLNEALITKADKDEVKAIRSALLRIMWGVLGVLGTTIASAILFYIQHSK